MVRTGFSVKLPRYVLAEPLSQRQGSILSANPSASKDIADAVRMVRCPCRSQRNHGIGVLASSSYQAFQLVKAPVAQL